MDAPLFIANDQPAQTLPSPPSELLQSSLEEILQTLPAKDHADGGSEAVGFFSGYTSLAYLFFQLSALRPDLQVLDHDLMYWAKQYMAVKREVSGVAADTGCGLVNERLCYDALQACITKEDGDVQTFLAHMPEILGPYPGEEKDPYATELLYGRTGVLFLLRLMRRSIPNSAGVLEEPISKLIKKIMETDDDGKGNWEWTGDRFFGPPHGDVGIITQLVLTDPSLAPSLSDKLEDLLSLQAEDGNWPSSRDHMNTDKGWRRVQYCHGAPGFVLALVTLRPFFPRLHERIDAAIEKGRETTWKRGLLTKEPNLCHGILGNAFAFPVGPRREHFLALATPEAIRKAKELDPKMFESASYSLDAAATLKYLPSAAWTWAVCEQDNPPMLLYNDV